MSTSDTSRYPFAVFCVRAYQRDDRPLSRHRKLERAIKMALVANAQFRSGIGNAHALLSYDVYEFISGKWCRLNIHDIT